MVRFLKIAAIAGCGLAFSAFPVAAQDLALPGLDLDPFHIFTPAPPPAAAAAPSAVAARPHHHWHHGHWHHHGVPAHHTHHHAPKH